MIRNRIGGLLVLQASLAMAAAPVASDPSRGELLYSTHCIACHTEQVHWRDKKLVKGWRSLVSEVNRWQGIANLGWSQGDIREVARYLNAIHYRYPPPNR